MASIGLRLDHNQGGTELAAMLAKAIYGNPMDKYNAANILSEIDNRSADTAYRQALTNASTAELGAKQGAIGAVSRQLQTAANGQFGAQPMPVEVAPVAPPPPAQAAPLPVEPLQDATPPASSFWRPTRPGQQVSGQDALDATAAAAPVVVDPTYSIGQPTMGPNLPGPMPTRPGQQVSGAAALEPPVAVEPDYRVSTFPMPSEAPVPIGDTVRNELGYSFTGHPDAPLPIDSQPGIDMSQGAQVTVPGRDYQYSIGRPTQGPNLPGPMPAHPHDLTPAAQPPASTPMQPPQGVPMAPMQGPPAPIAPSQTPPPPATPEQKQIAATQPPAQVAPGMQVDHGDGTVTLGTPNGPRRMPAADADAIAALIVFSNDPGGQAAKFSGQAGLLYNPANKLTPTETLATLAASGSELSKTSAASGTAGGSGLTGGYQGTGMDAQDQNRVTAVTQKLMAGQSLTQQEAIEYAGVYDRAWGQPKWHQMIDPNSADPDHPDLVDVPVYPTPPPNTPTVADAYRAAGLPAPAGGAVGASAGNTVVPSGANGGGVAAAGAPTAGGTVAPADGGAGGLRTGAGFVTKRGGGAQPTGPQAQAQIYTNAMTTANADLNKRVSDTDLLTPWEEANTNPTKYVGNTLTEMYNMYLRMGNPKIAKYWGEAMDFATAILRDESGAATRPEDMETVMERYIYKNGDSPAVRQKKALRREIAIQGMHDTAFPGATPKERLMAADQYLRTKLSESDMVNDNAAATAAAAPAAAAPAAGATAAKPRRVKLDDKGKLVDIP